MSNVGHDFCLSRPLSFADKLPDLNVECPRCLGTSLNRVDNHLVYSQEKNEVTLLGGEKQVIMEGDRFFCLNCETVLTAKLNNKILELDNGINIEPFKPGKHDNEPGRRTINNDTSDNFKYRKYAKENNSVTNE